MRIKRILVLGLETPWQSNNNTLFIMDLRPSPPSIQVVVQGSLISVYNAL